MLYINRWLRFCIGLASLSLAGPLFGKFVYVISDNDVSGFEINAVTGALTPIPGSPFAGVASQDSIAVDATAYGPENGSA